MEEEGWSTAVGVFWPDRILCMVSDVHACVTYINVRTCIHVRI